MGRLLICCRFRYAYPSCCPAHIFTISVAKLPTAIPFFFFRLVKLQEKCDYGKEQEQPGSGGDTYPEVDKYHREIHRMAGELVNAGGEWFVRRRTGDGNRRQNECHETSDKQRQSYPEPWCPYTKWHEDGVEGRADPESLSEKRHDSFLLGLNDFWSMAGPLGEMLGDDKHRQPLEWEYDHEQPSIPQTYSEGWHEGHNSLTLSMLHIYKP